jgi:hypothetical protein
LVVGGCGRGHCRCRCCAVVVFAVVIGVDHCGHVSNLLHQYSTLARSPAHSAHFARSLSHQVTDSATFASHLPHARDPASRLTDCAITASFPTCKVCFPICSVGSRAFHVTHGDMCRQDIHTHIHTYTHTHTHTHTHTPLNVCTGAVHRLKETAPLSHPRGATQGRR